MWRPFRPALCGVILDEESHGFSVDGTAQGLRYGRLGSLRYKGLPRFRRFHHEISGLGFGDMYVSAQDMCFVVLTFFGGEDSDNFYFRRGENRF
jgi:hypothetical protein